MKPERVIETRHDQVIARKREAVGQRRGRQQLEIGDVREQVLMQRPIIGQAVDGAYPDVSTRWQFSPGFETQRLDWTKLEGTLVTHETPQFHRYALAHIGSHFRQVLQIFWQSNNRHVRLVLKPFLGVLKRRRKVQYRPPVLDGDDATIGKTAAVARPVNVVNDRRIHVATAQKIRVQRVRRPALNRMLCRRQCLANHLATKNLGAADVTAVATEDVLFDSFKLEERNQVFEHRVHIRDPFRQFV